MLTPSDISYTIASTAPTNTDNRIQLNSIEYNGTDITSLLWKTALSFAPLFTAGVASGTPIVNTPHTFQTIVVTNRTTSITPTIITTMQIGDGTSAEWRSLSSSPVAICSNYPLTLSTNTLCDWSGVSVIATNSASDFAYTGTYVTWLPSATTDTTTMTGYVYYTTLGRDILYPTNSQILAPATP